MSIACKIDLPNERLQLCFSLKLEYFPWGKQTTFFGINAYNNNI